MVGPTQEIYDAILKIRTQGKPVVASMGSVAASGGYYLAAAATRIVANPGTLTGSIGVIMQLAEIEGLLKKVGVRYEVIKAGRFKDSASFARPMTPEERAVLQAVLDDMHDQFVTAIAEGRRLGKERVRALADGRVYSGTDGEEARPGRRPRGAGRGGPHRRASWAAFRASLASFDRGAPGGSSTWPDLVGGATALAWLRSVGWPGSGPCRPSPFSGRRSCPSISWTELEDSSLADWPGTSRLDRRFWHVIA